jgi:DNA-binding LacI/PurR family transcriptional regulator
MKINNPGINNSCLFIHELLKQDEYRCGKRLPGIRALAKMAGVSPTTMWKATRKLRKEGVLEEFGGGRFRAANATISAGEERIGANAWEKTGGLIRKDILQGIFLSGDMLPSRKELCARYGISFPTLKKSLDMLEKDGFVRLEKRSYAVSSKAALGRNAYVLLFCLGDRKGNLDLGAFNFDYIRFLQAECSRNAVGLRIIAYYSDRGEPRFAAEAGVAAEISDSEKLLGCLFLLYSAKIDNAKILAKIAHINKPAAVLDEIGGWEMPKGFARRNNVLFFSSLTGRGPGRTAARFLLGLGHKNVAFVSAIHASTWSQQRLLGLEEIYRAAGDRFGVRAFTNNAYSIRDEYLPQAEEHSDLAAFDKLYATWRNTVPDHVQDEFDGWVGAGARVTLSRAEMKSCVVSLCDEALKDTSITAWVVANDQQALMALEHARRRGIDVPAGISILGFDDTLDALRADLTSYNFNLHSAAHAMLNHIVWPVGKRNRRVVVKQEIEGAVVARQTTAAIKSN